MLARSNPRLPGRRTRLIRPIRGTLIAAVAAAAALSAPSTAAAEVAGPPPLRPRQPLIAVGAGQVLGGMPSCPHGTPGVCDWFIEGTHEGTPIRSGTFFVDINAGSGRRCQPATYSALLYDGPDDQIAHAAEGQLCPDRAGGRVFTGRYDNSLGYGRFQDVSSGRGHVRVTIAANGSATLTIAGHLRTG